MENEVSYKLITSAADFALAVELFRQYAAYIGIDLSFQNFEKELQALGGQYSAPAGALILAYLDGVAVGCVGVRRLDADIAELFGSGAMMQNTSTTSFSCKRVRIRVIPFSRK